MARLLAPGLSTALRRPIIIENVPGANGAIGMMRLKVAGPDERLLVLASDHASLLSPLTSSTAQYHTRRDFRVVGHVARHPYALAVLNDGTVRSLSELRARLRAQPATASIAVPAEGGVPEAIAAALELSSGVDVAVVPYRGGQPAAMALLGGQVSAAALGLSNVLALHKEGRVRILALTGSQRWPGLHQVPTFEEQALQGLAMTSSWTVFAAKNSTMDLAEINRAMQHVLSSASVQARLRALGLDPAPMGMADSAAELDRAGSQWLRASGDRSLPIH